MKPWFKAALYLQIVWFALAIGYNCLSLASMAAGGPGYAGDQAGTVLATVAVFMFGAVTLAGFMRRKTLYKILSPLVLVMLLVGGVLKHAILGPDSYASYGHWLTAILVNALWVIAYAVGAKLALLLPKKHPA